MKNIPTFTVPATWATGGVIACPALIAMWPIYPLGQSILGIASVCMATFCWCRVVREKKIQHELGRARWSTLPIAHLREKIPPGKIMLGYGARWQRRHALHLYELAGIDGDAITQDEKTKGDNRIAGVLWQETKPFYIDESDLNVHMLIYGMTKRGKTRIAESIALQAIFNVHAPIIIIDPKGDPQLRQRMEHAAHAQGVPFYCIDFANPNTSHTYNPLSEFTDPDQVGDRIAGLCAGDGKGDSAYFRGRAAGTAKIVARAMDAVRLYLEACGGKGEQPPTQLSALEQQKGFTELPAWFAPTWWRPRLSVLDIFGVTAIHRFLATVLRVVFAHALSNSPESPETVSRDGVLAWWKAYQDSPSHPADHDPLLQPLLREIRSQLIRLRDLLEIDQEHLQKANSSLAEALERFRGRVGKITDAAKPDIVWADVADKNAVVYFTLAAQEYRDLAEGFARALCEDLSAYFGLRSRTNDQRPIYLIADEVASWIPTSFTDFLARGRSAGLRCIAIGQTRADFRARLGPEGARIINGNAGTIVQFCSKERDEAEAAAKMAATSSLAEFSQSASTTAAYGNSGNSLIDGHSTNHSINRTERDKELFPAWAVQSLPTGTCLISTMTGSVVLTCPTLE
jgi:TraM recognition site of TraD and TraG